MYKKIILSIALLLSTKIWALSCSTPTTLSDPALDGLYGRVCTNEKGDAAVIWLSGQDKKVAVTVSHKTETSTWSSPEVISGWEKSIQSIHCFTGSNGTLFGTWVAVRGENLIVLTTEKEQAARWSPPLEWASSTNNFNCYNVAFDISDKLHFIGKTTTQQRYLFVSQKTVPAIGLLTKLPAQTEQLWDAFAAAEPIDKLTLALNKNGTGYAFWISNYTTLMSRKIQDGRFILEPEIIYNCPKWIYDLQANVNEEGDGVVLYRDSEKNVNIITIHENSISEPFLFSTKNENPFSGKISIDTAGNIMATYCVKIDDVFGLKTIYKPFAQLWKEPVLFSHPNAANWNPEIKPDGLGNFVMLWQQEAPNKKNAILGASFSSASQTWSETKLLSPESQHCFGHSFEFGTPGKGFISWITKLNGFDRSIQVAEICTNDAH